MLVRLGVEKSPESTGGSKPPNEQVEPHGQARGTFDYARRAES